MPRERRARVTAHQPSARLSKRQFAVQDNAVETVEVGAADGAQISGQDVLESLNVPPAIVGKKEKQQLKHEVFIDRIKSSTTPYSKAQKRRFNRKQREQLASGLGSIEAVISTLEAEAMTPSEETRSNVPAPQRRQPRPGCIGAGKGVPLTKAQRKRVFSSRELERFRHPRILTSSQYAANPFQTIRTHAQNTLERHTPPV